MNTAPPSVPPDVLSGGLSALKRTAEARDVLAHALAVLSAALASAPPPSLAGLSSAGPPAGPAVATLAHALAGVRHVLGWSLDNTTGAHGALAALAEALDGGS